MQSSKSADLREKKVDIYLNVNNKQQYFIKKDNLFPKKYTKYREIKILYKKPIYIYATI